MRPRTLPRLASRTVFAAALAVAAAAPSFADAPSATATLSDAAGKQVGTATLQQLAHGVLIRLTVTGLPPGPHGVHIHATGKCEPGSPAFASAGGHLNPGAHKHGFDAPDGHHAGDLPNLIVAADGTGAMEAVAQDVTLGGGPASLFGQHGTALVIHAKPDDYRTDPSGASGDRIACGVVRGGPEG